MVFSVRQLLEKTIEHTAKGFFVFIDLKKAYNSVPRECLWQVLSRVGVPPPMLAVIRSFHHEMSAVLRVSGTDVDPFSVTNGLRQGCTMAPVLFNIFMWAVVTKWQQRVRGIPGVGFEFSYHYGEGQLYHKARQADTATTTLEAQFADDSSLRLLATSCAGAGTALDLLNSTASEFGLTVSATKTNFLVIAGTGVTAVDQAPMQLAGVEIECVPEFKYYYLSLIHFFRRR